MMYAYDRVFSVGNVYCPDTYDVATYEQSSLFHNYLPWFSLPCDLNTVDGFDDLAGDFNKPTENLFLVSDFDSKCVGNLYEVLYRWSSWC